MRIVVLCCLLFAPFSLTAQSAPSSQPASAPAVRFGIAPTFASPSLVETKAPPVPVPAEPVTQPEAPVLRAPELPSSPSQAYQRSLSWTLGAAGASAACFSSVFLLPSGVLERHERLGGGLLLAGYGLATVAVIAPSAGYFYAGEKRRGAWLTARRLALSLGGGYTAGSIVMNRYFDNNPSPAGFAGIGVAFEGVFRFVVAGSITAAAIALPLVIKDLREARALPGRPERTLETRLSLAPLLGGKRASLGLGLSGRF